MSCSTTSLLAGTITTNTLTIEDPYIFTETVPTTPPTLFSNSQKSRSRFESKPQQQQQSLGTGFVTTATAAVNGGSNHLKDSLYVKARNYGAQTQTPSLVATAATATNFNKNLKTQTQHVNSQTAVLGVLNTNNLKKYETKTTKLLQQTAPSLLQRQQKHAQQIYAAQNENIIAKQQQQQLQQQPKTLSATPPPLLLSHTPSLWQTPLILENNSSTTAVKRETTKMPTLPAVATTATALVTPLNTVAGTTLMMATALPLPPSNFHHTTLAQHLQKLQCLKKPKKTNAKIAVATTAAFVQPPSPSVLTDAKQQTISNNQQQQQKQHSATDLNEIPVNVIFRAASTPSTATTTTTPSIQQNVTATPAVNKVEKEPKKPMSVSCTVKNQNQPPTKQRKNKKSIASKATPVAVAAATTATNAAPFILSNLNSNNNKSTTKKRQANTHLPHSKAQKRFRKSNFFPSLLNEKATVPDISLSTKAVAIVKRPYNECEKDAADENEELPFCVQRHWFYRQQYAPGNNKVSSREERLSEYKNALRRQAMQLLATRSLQRLPFHVARKRLICVDALLRKYRDHNKLSSSPGKQCEVEFCKNVALSMTTICQQHMAKNSKSIFVMCSAKNLQGNSVQSTTCNNPVLNIQKQYAPPLCCLHLNQQHQQQQNNVVAGKACESQINMTKSVQQTTRKRKFSAASGLLPASSYTTKIEDTTPLVSRTQMQRKNSTTSLESIASNSHSSFSSAIKPTTTISAAALPMQTSAWSNNNMLSPPALAPLSYNNNNNSSTNATIQPQNLPQQNHNNRTFSSAHSAIDPYAEQEINKLVAQFAMAAAAKTAAPAIANNNNNNNNNNFNSFNFMNTNSNSNLTSSGVGSSSSLPSTDELLTQDMLSNCENSSAYASSSEDTGLGELSESELMAVSSIADNIDANAIVSGFSDIGSVGGGSSGGGAGNGFNDDDVGPDEIPFEENDLVNVFGTLPVNLNELFNAVVQQDEREEVERALEIADKHLRSLQQTFGSDTNFLDDLLNVNDDMLVDADDMCSKIEIVSSDLPTNESLEVATLYLENAEKVLSNGGGGSSGGSSVMSSNNLQQVTSANLTMPTNCAVANNGANNGVMDIRGLLQT